MNYKMLFGCIIQAIGVASISLTSSIFMFDYFVLPEPKSFLPLLILLFISGIINIVFGQGLIYEEDEK